jgi:glycine betaine/proline transport system permease protein
MFPELFNVAAVRKAIDLSVSNWVANWGDTLEQLVYPVKFMLDTIEMALQAAPWPLVTLVIVALAFFSTRSVVTSVLIFLLTMFLGVIGLWQESMQTLALLIVSAILSIVVGIPSGIVVSRSSHLRKIVVPILDLMQTMPSFVYLIPAIMLFGPGKVPGLLATVVFALPPLIRLTDLGISQVDPEVVEASKAFGASPLQQLLGVQLPLALPSIMAGINQSTMMALSMAVIASMIGAGGIGYQVLEGITRLEIGRGLLAGLAIVAVAIIFDRITQGIGLKAAPREEGAAAGWIRIS